MISEGSNSRLGSEYDGFLFACIGEDRNGLPLSVASLLGRMNLDPWQEAKQLAAMPAEVAATRFAHSLDTLTDPVLRAVTSHAMVLRLLCLLPRNVHVVTRTPVADANNVAATTSDRATRISSCLFFACVIAWLGSRLIATYPETPVQPAVVQTPAVAAAPALTPQADHHR